jgi:protein involved in polysaccharide export with SLBB domain
MNRIAAILLTVVMALISTGCSFSTPAAIPSGKWKPVSQQTDSNPQLAESSGQVIDRCVIPPGTPQLRNASISEDRSIYRLERGDKLHLTFYRNSEFDQDVVVLPDGKCVVRPLGAVDVVGQTPQEFAIRLDRLFSDILIAPGANVSVTDSPSRVIYVGGQVATPGVQPLKPDETALQALISAGWAKDDAELAKLVLIRRDACGHAYGSIFQIKNAVIQTPEGLQQDVALMPSDIVVVSRSTVGNLNLWVAQYLRNMLPVQPYLGLQQGF